ncbi:endonuclease [Phenylobacterium deserti]|uniref:Endonuclease n=2 Tax=Phenylobacterium deserti TaxID=1914756 RepID=A0A328ABT8_9CAUL|nr:endonuclease [Phenylobacterium deserti]
MGAHLGRISLDWDVLAHFAPIWLAGAALGLVLGLLFRGRLRLFIVGIGLLGVVAGAWLVAPEYLRDTGPKAAAGGSGELKIVSLNVYVSNPAPEATADWILAQDPDVVILAEYRPEVRQRILERGGWNATCIRCDSTVLTRLPIVATSRAKGDGPLVTATLRDARGEFTVVGMHNAWPTDVADQQRQEERIRRTLRRFPGERTILAGDFNSAPWSFSRQRWDRTFGLFRRDRAIFSWPAQPYKQLKWTAVPFLPIDHVYAGSGWATVSIKRGPRLTSDHYPLITVLAPLEPR